jgi:hypothetical protein
MVVDVTSFISAEEFILSQNRGEGPLDPFARQCYAEVVQSLIFFDQILVPHPTLLQPRPQDFGSQPRILQHLFDMGVVTPLAFSSTEVDALARAEADALRALKTHGVLSLHSFIEKSAMCDREQQAKGGDQLLLRKIVEWNDFQQSQVRASGNHHMARIGTADGVEADPLGDWARDSARAMEGQLQRLLPDKGAQLHLTATLARSLRYVARANVKKVAYQAHPLRRDFCLTLDLTTGGASDAEILDVIREIRGIHHVLQTAAGSEHGNRLQLLELELPLLGGRLWTSQERGRRDDERWLRQACERLSEYRHRAAELRLAVSRCISEEDTLRLKLDMAHVRDQLLERLGLKRTELNETERELVRGVASVADSAIGLPVVSPLLIGGRALGQRYAAPGNAYQKFVYREFLGAWKKV